MMYYNDAKFVSKSKKQIEFIRLLSNYFESAKCQKATILCVFVSICFAANTHAAGGKIRSLPF